MQTLRAYQSGKAAAVSADRPTENDVFNRISVHLIFYRFFYFEVFLISRAE